MATTMAGAPITSGGFVLKSMRTGTLDTSNMQTFSVQNEGDFCIISNDFGGGDYKFYVSQIDNISGGFTTGQSSIVFGKNIAVKASGSYNFKYHIYEYGPAE